MSDLATLCREFVEQRVETASADSVALSSEHASDRALADVVPLGQQDRRLAA